MGMFDKKPVKAAPQKAAGVVKKAASRSRDEDEEIEQDGDDADDNIASGWGGSKKLAAENSSYANRLTMKDGDVIIGKFVDDTGPYATVATHWFDIGTGKKKERKSVLCPGSSTCPICATGDKPKVAYCFNIIAMTEDSPVLYSFERGKKDFDKIEGLAKVERYAPLSKMWYEVKRSGAGMNDTEYSFSVMKRISDIEEEYPDLRIPTDREFEKLAAKRYTKEDAKQGKVSMAEMKKFASLLSGDDDDEG